MLSEDFCPIDSDRIKTREPYPKVIASGNQIGSEDHEFVNGETISVCCAEVTSADNREFKDCIQYISESTIGSYHVSWEKNNGQYVKLMEEVIWQGNKCIYYFDEKGEWSRQCEKAEENIKEQLTLEQTLEKCDNKQDSYAKVACYENLAMEFGDPSYCSKWIELMEDNLNEQWCIEAVTRINNKINLISDGSNPNICEEGLSEDERNYCYLRVSRELKDPSICDHIDDVYFQGKC